MHDTDATNPNSPQPGALKEAGVKLSYAVALESAEAFSGVGETGKTGLLRRVWQFITRLFRRKAPKPRAAVIIDLTLAADRAAAARAAQMPPPMAFAGDTKNTMALPTSSYAGKPLEQAMRKRAGEQFKSLDLTRTTMH